MSHDSYNFKPIGIVHSPYGEKFGIPRQPGLVKLPAQIEMIGEYARAEAFRGLEDFSHIWISFVFHQSLRQHWKATVRPPRLGGNERVGVFASRSMFRPNPIGLSVVELSGIEQQGSGLYVNIVGADLMDGTPVLDIKPYLPYVDALPQARAGYAESPPAAVLQVVFDTEVEAVLSRHESRFPQLLQHVRQVLQYDPRPAYQPDATAARDYAMRLYGFDIKWRVIDDRVQVFAIDSCDS